MSQLSNGLLHLFGNLARSPRFMMALRLDMAISRLRRRQGRTGARGLLVALWEQDGLTNAEISELLDIRPSSVTAQVKNLEERGLVVRVTDENDRRVNRVFLTDHGKAIHVKRCEQHNSVSEDIFGVLSETEQRQLAELISRILDNSLLRWSGPLFAETDEPDDIEPDDPIDDQDDEDEDDEAIDDGLDGIDEDDADIDDGADGEFGFDDWMFGLHGHHRLPRHDLWQALPELRRAQQGMMNEFHHNLRQMWEDGDLDQGAGHFGPHWGPLSGPAQ